MNEIIIHIREATDEPGFFYDIYADEEALADNDTLAGGLCTTTIENALQMAKAQAWLILKKANLKL